MATDGQKVLSFAFKELTVQELEALGQKFDAESPRFREALEQDLIYLCTFGMNDPIRENV